MVSWRRQHRDILIRAGIHAVRARLHVSRFADRVWAVLPIYGIAEIDAGLLQFGNPEDAPHRSGLPLLAAGRLACSRDLQRYAIGLPVSWPSEPERLGTEWQVWATMRDDPSILGDLAPGSRVALLVAES